MSFPSTSSFPSPGPFPPAPSAVGRDVRLGPLRFITVEGDLKQALGDALETVGAVAIAGERRPRPFSLSLPVRGHTRYDQDIIASGERLRRQVIALVENARARLSGLWFEFAIDEIVSGWLLVGGADLSYTEQGTTFADYMLELTDCYRIGDRYTHRPGRRLTVQDRRLSTTPRDYLGKLRSTDFAGQPLLARHFLPVGATDLIAAGGQLLVGAAGATTIDGDVPTVDSRPDADVITFEQAATDEGKADVAVFDRRGTVAPAYTLAGDATPEGSYNWEQVYGPGQPLTANDVPVLENGRCRVRYVQANAAFAYDRYSAGVGYVEQARATVWRDSPAGTETQYATLVSAQVLEWTPERAVVRAVLSIDAQNRCELYLTLQRGWAGPRIEAYGAWTSAGKPGVAVRITPAQTPMTALGDSAGALVFADGTDYGTFATLEPWVYLSPPGGTSIHVAVLQAALRFVGRSGSAAYGGAARPGVSFVANVGSPVAGYVSVALGTGATGTAAADAQSRGYQQLADCRQTPRMVPR